MSNAPAAPGEAVMPLTPQDVEALPKEIADALRPIDARTYGVRYVRVDARDVDHLRSIILSALRSARQERDEYDRQRKLYHADMMAVREQRDATAQERDDACSLLRGATHLANDYKRDLAAALSYASATAGPWFGAMRAAQAEAKEDRAKAEAAEMRAASASATEAALAFEAERLARWQIEVAEGLGYVNRPDGQSGCEVAEPAVIVAAWREREASVEQLRDGLTCHVCSEVVDPEQAYVECAACFTPPSDGTPPSPSSRCACGRPAGPHTDVCWLCHAAGPVASRSESSQRAGKPADAAEATPAGAPGEPIASASEPPASTGERGGDALAAHVHDLLDLDLLYCDETMGGVTAGCACRVCRWADNVREVLRSGERSPRAGTAAPHVCAMDGLTYEQHVARGLDTDTDEHGPWRSPAPVAGAVSGQGGET